MRLAHSLRLGSDAALAELSPQDARQRSNIFWVCYMLDKVRKLDWYACRMLTISRTPVFVPSHPRYRLIAILIFIFPIPRTRNAEAFYIAPMDSRNSTYSAPESNWHIWRGRFTTSFLVIDPGDSRPRLARGRYCKSINSWSSGNSPFQPPFGSIIYRGTSYRVRLCI